MYVIGIDPHKGSHTAAVLDRDEELLGELRVVAGRRQRDELVAFAAGFEPRTWAIEAASGWGALLAQQLIAAGETRPGRPAGAVGPGSAAGRTEQRQDRPP
jgi:transposase